METLKADHQKSEDYIPKEQIRGIQKRFGNQVSELSVLHELGRAIINVHDFRKLCGQLLDIIIQNTIAENCSIMFLDRKKKCLYLICATDYNKQTYIIDPKKVFSKDEVIYIPDADRGAGRKGSQG